MNERDKTSTQKQPNEWRDVDFRSDAPDRPRPPGMPKPGPWRIAQGYQDDVELPALICGENEKEMTIVEECFDFYPGDVALEIPHRGVDLGQRHLQGTHGLFLGYPLPPS